ncbi:MAG: lipocalin [Burkholderiales bacterium]|nr:MAG: lipocalin [Burkholderiales bacterium]
MIFRKLFTAGLLCITSLVASAQTDPAKQPLAPVASIDLQRYQGLWYQLALYPNRFQKFCASNTRAQYAQQPGGTIQVTNQCRGEDGKDVQAIGQARAARVTILSGGQLTPPQLQVRFAPEWLSWLPFVWGNYWVIQLAPDYRYAVVGEPSREFLWILARDTQLSPADWSTIEARLKEQGYDPAKLVREKHLP